GTRRLGSRFRAQGRDRVGLEGAAVQPEVGSRSQAQYVGLSLQDLVPNQFGQAVERAPQPAPDLALVSLGPEEAGQGVAALGAGEHGQVHQEGYRPPQRQLDRMAMAFEP